MFRLHPVIAISLVGLLAAVVASAITLWPDDAFWDALFERLEGLGAWLWLALIVLMILHNIVPIPAELIAVFAGATLGLGAGVAVIWVGAMLGALIAFWVARRYGRPLVNVYSRGAVLGRLDRFVAAGDWRGLLAVRLLPIVSFNLVNYAAGLSGVGWGRFAWTTALGILPVTILSVAVGAGLQIMGAGPALIAAAALLLLWLMAPRLSHLSARWRDRG